MEAFGDSRRERILEVAMRRFAEDGFRQCRVEDIAADVGVGKGTVFLHFGSKEGLFMEAWRRAVEMLPRWLDAPGEVVDRGFWAVLDYWLRGADTLYQDLLVANRVAIIGRYDSGMGLRGGIERFMRSEDPYGTLEFVEFGVRRGDLRDDVDAEMIASMLDWAGDRFQDALAHEEFDPGLVRRSSTDTAERRERRIVEFIELLRTGIGPR